MSNHLDIVWTNQFKKDYKLAMKRHLDIDLLDDIIRKLASSEQLPEKNKDHALLNGVRHSYNFFTILPFPTPRNRVPHIEKQTPFCWCP